MKASEFALAARIARSSQDLSTVDDSPLWGCGLPGFVPVFVTVEQVAKFVRYQTVQFNGGIDAEAMAECAKIARKAFLIV